jgi:hypothetical protein
MGHRRIMILLSMRPLITRLEISVPSRTWIHHEEWLLGAKGVPAKTCARGRRLHAQIDFAGNAGFELREAVGAPERAPSPQPSLRRVINAALVA